MPLESKWATSSDEEEEIQKAVKQIEKTAPKNTNRKRFDLNDLSSRVSTDKPSISFIGGKLSNLQKDASSNEAANSRPNSNKSNHSRPNSNRKENYKSRTNSNQQKNLQEKPSISFANGKMTLSNSSRQHNNHEEDWEDDDGFDNNSEEFVEEEHRPKSSFKSKSKSPQKSKERTKSASNDKPSIYFSGGKLSVSNEKPQDHKNKSSKKTNQQKDSNLTAAAKLELLKKKIEEQKNIFKDNEHKKEQKQLLNAFLNNDDAFNWEDESEEEEILNRLKNNVKI